MVRAVQFGVVESPPIWERRKSRSVPEGGAWSSLERTCPNPIHHAWSPDTGTPRPGPPQPTVPPCHDPRQGSAQHGRAWLNSITSLGENEEISGSASRTLLHGAVTLAPQTMTSLKIAADHAHCGWSCGRQTPWLIPGENGLRLRWARTERAGDFKGKCDPELCLLHALQAQKCSHRSMPIDLLSMWDFDRRFVVCPHLGARMQVTVRAPASSRLKLEICSRIMGCKD